MRALRMRLRNLMVRRARFRIYKWYPSLDDLEVCQLSMEILRGLKTKLEFEKYASETLGDIQRCYKEINSTVQTTVEMYHDVLENLSPLINFAGLEEAIDALSRLERETATFRKTVNSLLRAAFMREPDAWSYLRA